MRVRNTDVSTRVWISLANSETGATLELGPGQEGETDLPDGFTDPHLVPVRAPKKAAPADETAESTSKEK